MTVTLFGKHVNLRTLYCPTCVGQGQKSRVFPQFDPMAKEIILDCPSCQHVTHIPAHFLDRVGEVVGMTETFASEIERAARGEPILGVVIGRFGWGRHWEVNRFPEPIPQSKRGVVLSWEEARPLLDYTYNDGYGAPDCHAITAWTPNQVLFVVGYDGSTWVDSVPRHPVDHWPEMCGQ